MADKRRINVEERKDIYTNGWRVEDRDNLLHHNMPVVEYKDK